MIVGISGGNMLGFPKKLAMFVPFGMVNWLLSFWDGKIFTGELLNFQGVLECLRRDNFTEEFYRIEIQPFYGWVFFAIHQVICCLLIHPGKVSNFQQRGSTWILLMGTKKVSHRNEDHSVQVALPSQVQKSPWERRVCV